MSVFSLSSVAVPFSGLLSPHPGVGESLDGFSSKVTAVTQVFFSAPPLQSIFHSGTDVLERKIRKQVLHTHHPSSCHVSCSGLLHFRHGDICSYGFPLLYVYVYVYVCVVKVSLIGPCLLFIFKMHQSKQAGRVISSGWVCERSRESMAQAGQVSEAG